MSEELQPYPVSGTSGRVREVVEALVQIVPGGSTGVGLVRLVFEPNLSKRRTDWERRLTVKLEALIDHVDTIDANSLLRSERLTDAIAEATIAAARTHHEEKLEALANAVVSAASPDAIDEHLQATFMRWIEELTPMHLRALAYLCDPSGWFDVHPELARPEASGSRRLIFDAAIPELSSDRDFADLVLRELSDRGLQQFSQLTGMVSSGTWDAGATNLGKLFVVFINPPWT